MHVGGSTGAAVGRRRRGEEELRVREAYDTAGHHAQVCGMHGRTEWQRGHESVVHAWAELAKEANVSVDTRQGLLLRPVHTGTDQRGDIKFNLRGPNVSAAVSDVSITHVAFGSGPRRDQWGTFKHQAWLTGSGPRTAPTPPSIGTRTWSSWPWLGPRGQCSLQWGWPCTTIWRI